MVSGGCAFNSVANGKICKNTPFKKTFIQAAAGDAGNRRRRLKPSVFLLHLCLTGHLIPYKPIVTHNFPTVGVRAVQGERRGQAGGSSGDIVPVHLREQGRPQGSGLGPGAISRRPLSGKIPGRDHLRLAGRESDRRVRPLHAGRSQPAAHGPDAGERRFRIGCENSDSCHDQSTLLESASNSNCTDCPSF